MAKLMEIVRTNNPSILMAIERMVLEDDLQRVEETKRKIHKLIKKRSWLLGLSGTQAQVEVLTAKIEKLKGII